MPALPDCCGRFPAGLAAPSRLKTLAQLGATVVLLGLLASLVGAGSATAAAPCWKQLVNDYWTDERVDRLYPISCYREAMEHLPPDVVNYSDARDEIRRALLSAIREQRDRGGFTSEEPEPDDEGSGGGPGGGGGGTTPRGPIDEDEGSRGAFGELLNKLGPKNADSVPLPLLVLGSIALLLFGAAGASYLARWLQARRMQPATASAQPREPRI